MGGFFDARGVKIPVAVSAFPDEIYTAPQSWAERAYPNLLRYDKHDKGGHFAAWEQPEVLTHDLREAAFLADTVYVMSRRPGRIVYRCPIDISRPRTLATTFTPAYIDIVNELRARIAEIRSQ